MRLYPDGDGQRRRATGVGSWRHPRGYQGRAIGRVAVTPPAGQQFPASTCGGLLCWRPVSLCKQQHTVGGLYKIKPGWIWRCIRSLMERGSGPGVVRELVEAVDHKIPARTIARLRLVDPTFCIAESPNGVIQRRQRMPFALSPTGRRGLLRISNPRPAG